MASKLLSAGRALGKAQGGAAKAGGILQGINTAGRGIQQGMENYQARIKEQQRQTAARTLGAELDIDPQAASQVGPEQLLQMLGRRREADARFANARQLEHFRGRMDLERDRRQDNMAQKEEQRRMALTARGLKAGYGDSEQTRGMLNLMGGGASLSAAQSVFAKDDPEAADERWEIGGQSYDPSDLPTDARMALLRQRHPGVFPEEEAAADEGQPNPRDVSTMYALLTRQNQSRNMGLGEQELRERARFLASDLSTSARIDQALGDDSRKMDQAISRNTTYIKSALSAVDDDIAAARKSIDNENVFGSKDSEAMKAAQADLSRLMGERRRLLGELRSQSDVNYDPENVPERDTLFDDAGEDYGAEFMRMADELRDEARALGGN